MTMINHYKNFKTGTLAIFAACMIFMFFMSCSRQSVYPQPPHKGSDVAIEVRGLQTETPVFYTYHYQNKNINFFVVKMDKKTLSFLDACTNCYREKLGYKYVNGYLVCRACNMEYVVSNIEKGFGSCFPIRLQGRLQGNEYRIPVSALERLADKF